MDGHSGIKSFGLNRNIMAKTTRSTAKPYQVQPLIDSLRHGRLYIFSARRVGVNHALQALGFHILRKPSAESIEHSNSSKRPGLLARMKTKANGISLVKLGAMD